MQKTVVVLEKTICDKQELKIGISIVKLISLFVYELSKEAQINQEVKSISKEKSMWILFRDSCFQCDYIIEYDSEIIAAISEEFPIIISGIINEFEVGELRIFLKDGKLKIQKRNVTGKDFDMISDLCIKINVEDDDKLEVLNEILINIRYNKRCIAIRRKWNKYFLNDETVEEEKFTIKK